MCIGFGCARGATPANRKHADDDARWEDRGDWQMTEPRTVAGIRSRCVQFACERARRSNRGREGTDKGGRYQSSVPSVVQREAFE